MHRHPLFRHRQTVRLLATGESGTVISIAISSQGFVYGTTINGLLVAEKDLEPY